MIGTSGPAAMIWTPSVARSPGTRSGRVLSRHDQGDGVAGVLDRLRPEAGLDEGVGVGRVRREEHVGRGAFLDLGPEGGRRVGRDDEVDARAPRRLVLDLDLVEGVLERGRAEDGQLDGLDRWADGRSAGRGVEDEDWQRRE